MMEKSKVIVMYLPVIHQGYLDFLGKYVEDDVVVYLLDKESIATSFPELEYLNRDLRAVDTQLIKKSLALHFPTLKIRMIEGLGILSVPLLNALSKYDEIIMPADDVSTVIYERFANLQNRVTFEHAFLRWDANASVAKKEINVPTIHHDDLPEHVIAELKKQGSNSADWWRRVSCVLYDKDNVIILATYNHHFPNDLALNIFGDPRFNFKPGENIEYCSAIHAEAWAIGIAARNGIKLAGLNMLVSDFPCPVCAKQISKIGIKNLLFVQGYSSVNGQEDLEAAGIKIYKVLLENN